MNLLEKIKSLHLDKMVVTNSELSFFLYNSSDALSHDKETKIAVEKCMKELDYENRDGFFEKKIHKGEITNAAKHFHRDGVEKIAADDLSKSLFDDENYLMYEATTPNFCEIVAAMSEAGYKYNVDYNSDGTERGYFKYEPALVPVPKTTQDMVNPFKKFTDELAKTLKVKNDAYADSFDKTLDKFGLNVAVARINDKYDRLENIILHPDTEQNDESPKDTLMDLAGYSILLVKYMESRGLYSD